MAATGPQTLQTCGHSGFNQDGGIGYLHDDVAVVEAVIIVVILFSTWAPVLFLQGFMKGTMKTQSTNSTNEVTIDKHPHFLPCGRTGPTPSRLPARSGCRSRRVWERELFLDWCSGKGRYFWIDRFITSSRNGEEKEKLLCQEAPILETEKMNKAGYYLCGRIQ